MTEQDKGKPGATLWAIANQLRSAMNADDFRDYMLSLLSLLSFLFFRYLSENYQEAAHKEPGRSILRYKTAIVARCKHFCAIGFAVPQSEIP